MRKIKTMVSMLLILALAMSLVACGKDAGELPTDATARAYSESDMTEVYIDDEAIALAGSFAEESQDLRAAALQAFELCNQQRAAAGLPALVWSEALSEAAYVRSMEIVSVFSHTRPNGSDWWTVNSAIMYGENLARGFSSAQGATEGWMNSPTHKANMLDGGFKTLGIAVFRGSDGKLYWAQEFGY